MAELNLNPDTVCFLIERAREFHAKEQVVIPETPNGPTDDWALQVLADHMDDYTLAEARVTVDDLEPDQQAELVALMWVGRGDYDVEEWGAAIDEARDTISDNLAEYLMSHPMLADYLTEGLVAFDLSCEE